MTARKFKDRDIVAKTFVWRDLTIRVACERGCFGLEGQAHLTIETVRPKKAMMPISETGYRSHFLPVSELDDSGGPVPYVRAWLDHAATSRRWREAEAAARQLSLF